LRKLKYIIITNWWYFSQTIVKKTCNPQKRGISRPISQFVIDLIIIQGFWFFLNNFWQ